MEFIEIDERYRIRKLDALNWTVEELREVKSNGKPPRMEWRGANGRDYGPYFARPGLAAKWLLDRMAWETPGKADLERARREYERAAVKILAAVEKAVAR